MKWIGAILILFTCTWVGIDIAKNFKKRPKQLRELLHALQIMEAEMVYGQEPIHQVLIQLSRQLTPPISCLFYDIANQLQQSHQSLSTIWYEEIQKKWKFTSMKNKEKEILIQFGQTLGVHNLEQQQKQIHLAKIHLQHELSDASDDEKKFAGLFRTLGVLTGLFLMLIFI
ncbi:stage III sporulation protein SpoIIIAB [Bacillaceae bacterium W0354]